MFILLFVLQFDWKNFTPEGIFGGQILERTPAGLTIVYLIGIAVLTGFLVLSFIDLAVYLYGSGFDGFRLSGLLDLLRRRIKRAVSSFKL
jgi:hypothetical protein